MRLSTPTGELEFISVRLIFHRTGLIDLFALKNNKTVAESLGGEKYRHLVSHVIARYPDSRDERLGEFLLRLKGDGDQFYRRFLNKYGDRVYCNFSISEHLSERGLYCFSVDGEIRYIGRSHDPFRKRINYGYGNISPKNCYLDGQATNCHLNALIAQNSRGLELHVCPITEDHAIDELERELIRRYAPPWNLALRAER